jgi:Flp pilus assembly protein CpaB
MARSISMPGRVGEPQNRLALYGAIGLALLAAIFAFAALRAAGGGDGNASASLTTLGVVVTTREIPAGSAIEDGMLTIANVPEDVTIDGYLTSTDGLMGAGFIAQQTLARGDQVTYAKLGGGGDSDGLSGTVPPGRLAVSVGVTEEKVFGGLLAPGDRVDVIAIIQRTVGDTEVPTAVTIAQNAEVLAVADAHLRAIGNKDTAGETIETETSTGVIAAAPEDVDTQPDARSVTLSVAQEEALLIALAQEEWSVWLALRSPADVEIRPIQPQTLDTGGSSGSDGE